MIQVHPSTLRAARRLRQVTLAAIVLLVGTTLLATGLLLVGREEAGGGILRIDTAGLSPVPGALVQLATGILVAMALLRLAQMLGRIEEGIPFETATGLRGFAFYLFLSVLASILLPPLLQLGLAATGGGARQATLALGGDEVLMLFVTGLLALVARLLDEAQRVADDASQIV